MRLPRIKFIWGGAKQVPGHWHLGLWGTYQKQVAARRKVAVSVRGGLLWLGGVVVAAYLAGATALFFWFDRNDDNLVTYGDTLLLPLRWDEVREKRGRMMIEEGLADLREKRWAEANMKLRVGLSRAPRESRARLALAKFYVWSNRRPQAIALLVEGLGAEYPGKAYLTTLFSLANESEDYEPMLAAGERYAESAGVDRAWLLAQRLAALNGAGRHDEALQLAEQEGEAADGAVREATALALVELGRGEEALKYLEEWERAIPGHRLQVTRLRVRALREAGRVAEMASALQSFRELTPTDPRAYVYGIVQRWLVGDRAGAEEALENYFQRFAAVPQNLTMAASAAADAKALPLVRRCVERSATHGFRAGPMLLVLLQAELVAGENEAAKATLANAKRSLQKPEPVEEFALTWLERLLAVALQPDAGAEAALIEFFRQRPMPLRVYRQTTEILISAGRPGAARSVLDLAVRSYGASRSLASLRETVERSLAVAQDPARGQETLVSVRAAPEAGKFFEALAQLEREERWTEAAQRLREVRVAKPAWLSSREAEVLDAQMRVASHTGDTLEMLGAAKLFLDGDVNRALRVVAFAHELGERGQQREGELLLREVLRKHADFPPALRLQKEWVPDEAGDTKAE